MKHKCNGRLKALKKTRTKTELIGAVLELMPKVRFAVIPKHVSERISVTPPKVLGERNCTPPMQKLLKSSQKILAASHCSQSAARDMLAQLENSPTVQRLKYTAKSIKAEEKKKNQDEQLKALKMKKMMKKKNNTKRKLVPAMKKTVEKKKGEIVEMLSEIVQEEEKKQEIVVCVEKKKKIEEIVVEEKIEEIVAEEKIEEIVAEEKIEEIVVEKKIVQDKKIEETVVYKVLEKIVDDVVEEQTTTMIEEDWVFIEEEPKKSVCTRVFSSNWIPTSLTNAYNQIIMRIERMRV
jgi:hypothetical protein